MDTPHGKRYGHWRLACLPLAVVALSSCASAGPANVPSSPEPQPALRRHNVLPLPVIFYTPETRWAGGAAVIYAYRSEPEARPATAVASVIYTQNRQTAADIGTEGYTSDGRYHLKGGVAYSKFPTLFYGIGNATPAAAEEKYTARSFRAEAAVERRVANALYMGLGAEYARRTMLEVEPGRALADGRITGSDGGVLSAIGGTVTFDSRDNIIASRSGGYAQLAVRRYSRVIGSDLDFTRTSLDVRGFRSLAGGHVIGVQGAWAGTWGRVPFDRLPELGGQNLLRGYYQGRYRDRHALALQTEYRSPVWRRIGFVAFAGMGEVAGRVTDFNVGGIHAEGGAGMRFVLNRQERMALRLDYGFARDASGMYISVGEAF